MSIVTVDEVEADRVDTRTDAEASAENAHRAAFIRGLREIADFLNERFLVADVFGTPGGGS